MKILRKEEQLLFRNNCRFTRKVAKIVERAPVFPHPASRMLTSYLTWSLYQNWRVKWGFHSPWKLLWRVGSQRGKWSGSGWEARSHPPALRICDSSLISVQGGSNAIYWASRHGHVETLTFLSANRCPLDVKDKVRPLPFLGTGHIIKGRSEC